MNSEPSDKQKAQAFDSYVKKNLKFSARTYNKIKSKRGKREVSLSALSGEELVKLAVMDKYFENTFAFDVLGMKISVLDYELGEALNGLPADLRRIVLLYYFLDMPDNAIAEHLHIARSTIAYRRTSTLRKLKKFLEDIGYE